MRLSRRPAAGPAGMKAHHRGDRGPFIRAEDPYSVGGCVAGNLPFEAGRARVAGFAEAAGEQVEELHALRAALFNQLKNSGGGEAGDHEVDRSWQFGERRI